jgi:outer membrane protein assembly factor BamB
VNASRHSWRLVAGAVVMLLALVVVGRLQGGNLPGSNAGGSRATSTTVAEATAAASGLAVAGRVALPGPAAAVAVGEGAVWVLLEEGSLLRVDPDRHQVTGRLELGAPSGDIPTGPWDVRVGPLAVGAGAVWVGTHRGRVTVRADPVRLRVTARFGGHAVVVAHGVLWSYCCRRGDKVMGFGRVDARTLRARPPLVVTDAAGRRQPVGPLAVGADALWTLPLEGGRLWRVPLAGGVARSLRVAGFPYGLAADGGAVWVLSGAGAPGSGLDQTARLRRLDPRTGKVTVTTPLPDLAVGQSNVGIGLVVGDGTVWVAGPYARGLHAGGILLRVDPASGRPAGWLRDPRWSFQGVLAAGPRGAWVTTTAPELLHVVAA